MNTPEHYAKYGVLAQELGKELIARLSWTKLQPKTILDLGCGIGEQMVQLSNLYKDAHVIGVDNDLTSYPNPFLHKERGRRGSSCICADATQLPLANQSIDLLFANLVLPWIADYSALLREGRRILREGGLFTFSTLGPGTFPEWQDIFPEDPFLKLIDMHDIGDGLIQTGFLDPVLDVDYFTFRYRSATTFWQELTVAGILPLDASFRQHCEQEVEARAARGQLTITFEVVYCHAWAPSVSAAEFQSDDQGMVSIPLSHLRRRRTG